MVIKDIKGNTGEAPALPGENPFAGKYVRMLVGKPVDSPVVANALPHRVRECREIDTPGKVAEDAAHPGFG